MLSASQIGILARAGKGPTFTGADADIWADISGRINTQWPVWNINGAVAANQAPNDGNLGGYWSVAYSQGPGTNTGVYTGGSYGNYLYIEGEQFRHPQLFAPTFGDTTQNQSGAEKHYAARTRISGEGHILPGIYHDGSGTLTFGIVYQFAQQQFSVALANNTESTIFWGWSDGQAYLEVRGGASNSIAFVTDATTFASMQSGAGPSLSFVPEGGGNRYREYHSWARTSVPGTKAAFQAWFNAQFP